MISFLFLLVAASDFPACDSGTLSISRYAHATNEAFIEKVTSGHGRQFVPQMPLAAFDASGHISKIDFGSEKFLSYSSDNGWNNQLLNLLCAIDMAQLTNRTLIVPVFQWPRRRGNAKVSVARLIDLGSVARLGVRVICEDEAGSVAAALSAARIEPRMIQGEGQPHRRRRMPRWSRDEWLRTASGADQAIQVTCCLFWTWTLPTHVARQLYTELRYHPMLEAAAREAARPLVDEVLTEGDGPKGNPVGPSGNGSFAAMHVRRGDKARVDSAYTAVFGGKMTQEYFTRLARDEGFASGSTVFVATDELDRSWFRPLGEAPTFYQLRFVEDLDQRPLLEALSAFPQGLWADVLAILEQIICINAPGGFVGSLPSTLSGHVVNARTMRTDVTSGTMAIELDGRGPGPQEERVEVRPLFTKLHESCCDARTALDLLKLPGVTRLEEVPCVAAVEGC